MIRMQIQLDRDDHAALKWWATRHGVSLSGAVRTLVRERLRGESDRAAKESEARFLAAAGCVRARRGEGNVAEKHDSHLYGDRRR